MDPLPVGEGQSSQASVFTHPGPINGDSHVLTSDTDLDKVPLCIHHGIFFLAVSSLP